jgi:anthranilate/para-aminobenzoate synthase component I
MNMSEENINIEPSSSASSLAVCCSSPERFIGLKRQKDNSLQAEAKPIKGTCTGVLPQNGVMRTDAEQQEDTRVQVCWNCPLRIVPKI